MPCFFDFQCSATVSEIELSTKNVVRQLSGFARKHERYSQLFCDWPRKNKTATFNARYCCRMEICTKLGHLITSSHKVGWRFDQTGNVTKCHPLNGIVFDLSDGRFRSNGSFITSPQHSASLLFGRTCPAHRTDQWGLAWWVHRQNRFDRLSSWGLFHTF